ncbi:MAG: endonuclease MutS2 [Clostridiaceae bacterium]|nr:endonuclease MutS2 [Clostridiaceae bacterium]
MNSHSSLEKLEYNKILEQLSLCCNTYLGKDFSMQLKPSITENKVNSLLSETLEAYNFIYRKGNIPLFEIADISLSLKKLESNIALSAKSLLEIAYIFKLSQELKLYFKLEDDLETKDFPILFSYFNLLYSNYDLEKSIFSSIIDENTISDNASSKLSSIRRNKKKLESDIKDVLNKIIHSQTYSKAIMEAIITIRNDRYVIPVKEEFRSSLKGFIHDISSSGSTVFIEPMQVFELNNKLQSLKIEENLEIEHILEQLSFKISPYISELKENISLIGKLDFIFAKATLAKNMDATCPIINNLKQIDIKKARHPLISKDNVVPIDIKIGSNYSSLIITGPNTGGKTVTLKTTGLLTLMACSGLFIPAEEKSSLYVFDSVFADIGDEQSIQESLSTFSSHMTHIISILRNATSNSLILLDELGSGTDPIEGANLAISILEYFNKLGTITIATTHYQEIKNYALTTDGFENASCAFDIENLKPTYQLLIGIPGKSNAFAISKKLGLSDEILDRAKFLIKDDDINIEGLLKNIYDDKIIIENEKEEIIKNKNQIESLRKSLEQEKNIQSNEKLEKLEKAKIDAQNILISAKEEANDVIKNLNNLYDNFKCLENINFEKWSDLEISDFVKQHFKKGSLKKANNIRNDLNNSFDSLLKNSDSNIETNINKKHIELNKENLQIGMKVKLYDFSDIATITSLSGKQNQLQIQISNAKMNIKIEDIQEIIETDIKKIVSLTNSKKSSISILKSKQIAPEINVIGENIEEACFVIDKYLDDCILAKISPIRIVHGKGTGKLRAGIHSFLKKNPYVKSYRLGTFGEGEMGVTIVELK